MGKFPRRESFVRRDLHVSASKRIGPGPGATSGLCSGSIGMGQLPLLALAPTSVSSVLIDCTAAIDERCWMVVFIESFAVSVSVCVVLYRCVCLLSFGFNISF